VFSICQEFSVSEEQTRRLTGDELGLLNPNDPKHLMIFYDYLWKQFSIASAFGCLFCTGKSDAESGVEVATDTGLLQNHGTSANVFVETQYISFTFLIQPMVS
jgi:hypothetical protein